MLTAGSRHGPVANEFEELCSVQPVAASPPSPRAHLPGRGAQPMFCPSDDLYFHTSEGIKKEQRQKYL